MSSTTYRVIVEPPGGAPYVAATSLKYTEASALCLKVAEALKTHRGTKVMLQRDDSRDQLQVSRFGKVVRDQPALPAEGQDVTVYAPTAHLKARAQ